MSRYRRPLEELEAVHVPVEEQVAEQETQPAREFLEPEDYDRLRLLNDPTHAGRLHPR